jgi:hypothetical protein
LRGELFVDERDEILHWLRPDQRPAIDEEEWRAHSFSKVSTVSLNFRQKGHS